jgi:hypothetical protein
VQLASGFTGRSDLPSRIQARSSDGFGDSFIRFFDVGYEGLGLDLNAPTRVKERTNDDERRRGLDVSEELSMRTPHRLPIVCRS